MKKFYIAFSLWLLAFSFTQAATINFVPSDKAIIDQEFRIQLVLETKNENINALEGEIVWPSDKLELIGINDDLSIVSLWIRDPKKLATSTLGSLIFSGLIPSGYSEPKGEIITLTFRPLVSGRVNLVINKALILLNDGKSTPAEVEINPLEIKIRSNSVINQLGKYLLFLIVGIIIAILLWRIIRRRKSGAV